VDRTGPQTGVVVTMQARFHTSEEPLVGVQLRVLPDERSLEHLFAKMGV